MRPVAVTGALALLIAALSCAQGEPSVCAGVIAAAGAGARDAGAGDAGDAGAGTCGACGEPLACGAVKSTAVRTASGVAASAIHDRVFYLHNGSVELPRFYAVDDTGADRGTFVLQGATNVDWEDIAVGPCPAGSCVFIADIGDERALRATYTIYRVPEPSNLGPGEQTVTAERLSFTYPDGSRDAQALLVHPKTGVITVVTRDRSGSGAARIYDVPALPDGSTSTAILRKQIAPAASSGLRAGVTGGDVHARGGVLLRTTAAVLLFPLGADQTIADAIAADATPCELPVWPEADGHSIAWLRSGLGYVTVDRGPSPGLHYVRCGAL